MTVINDKVDDRKIAKSLRNLVKIGKVLRKLRFE